MTSAIFIIVGESGSGKKLIVKSLENKYGLKSKYGAITEQTEAYDLYIMNISEIDYFKEHYNGDKRVCLIYISVPEINRYLSMIRYGETIENSLKKIQEDRKTFKDFAKKANVIINNDNLDNAVSAVYQYIQEVIKL